MICCRYTDSPAAFSGLAGVQCLPDPLTEAAEFSGSLHTWPGGAVVALAACHLFAMGIAVTSGLLSNLDVHSQHGPCRVNSYLFYKALTSAIVLLCSPDLLGGGAGSKCWQVLHVLPHHLPHPQ